MCNSFQVTAFVENLLSFNLFEMYINYWVIMDEAEIKIKFKLNLKHYPL